MMLVYPKKNEYEFWLTKSSYFDVIEHSFYFHHYCVEDHMLDTYLYDDYRFNSILFDGLKPQDAINVGYELLRLVNGFIKIHSDMPSNIKIQEIRNDNIPVREFKFDELNSTYLNNLIFINNKYFDLALIDGWHSKIKNRNGAFFDTLFYFMRNDYSIKLIIEYFNFELNLITMYKILDSLEHFYKELGVHWNSKEINNDSDKNICNEFTRIANNFEITGHQARHGFGYKKKAQQNNKPSKYTIEQYQDFFKKKARQYLAFVLEQHMEAHKEKIRGSK